eukprot:NODE_214_length_2466_cov_102.466281_g165_i0.p1 GENE.NODE_214_length_2466_cov_102.466281_g165_i0~~NODE_214_length_2466_cov_102.466281_g165_i0.p1  ORF type:complete len:746 (+),score=204.83 NODE_214_length_2466_cov_102.466281_g165_i0:146-2383(+)
MSEPPKEDVDFLRDNKVPEVISKVLEGMMYEKPKDVVNFIHNATAPYAKNVKDVASAGTPLVKRCNLEKMPDAATLRFANALKKMMENTDGPQTSPFFKLAAHHGWPNNYCAHGQEHFPAWHRAYLSAFEMELQKADRALGNDGKIGLPYWDFGESERIPAVIREHFGDIPKDLVTEHEEFVSRGYSKLYSDVKVGKKLKKAKVLGLLEDCLREEEHWKHASTRSRRGVSLEQPHNSAHVALGYPLNKVSHAAYHPMFWLLHCNIDRIYEKYLALYADSAEEFMATQEQNQDNGEPNRFLDWCEPFYHPIAVGPNGQPKKFYPADSFSAAALGFEYDTLPATPSKQMREMPTFAIFDPIDVFNLRGKSYFVHCFVAKKGEAFEIPKDKDPDDYDDVKGYAGSAGVFGGKGAECSNCLQRGPLTVRVDVTAAMRDQGVASRYECTLYTCAEDDEGVVTPISETPIPEARLVGPFFEDSSQQFGKGAAGDRALGEVTLLQEYLRRFVRETDESGGDFAIDGDFGPKTEEMVKLLQLIGGVDSDGLVGPKTKAVLSRKRFDGDKDKGPDKATFPGKTELNWFLGTPPGYLMKAAGGISSGLGRTFVREVATTCFNQWAQGGNIKFNETTNRSQADITVLWTDLTDRNMSPFSDGPGGAYGHTIFSGEGENRKATIYLDSSEVWSVKDASVKNKNENIIYLEVVLLHEIGHAIGVTHALNDRDIMGPFYAKDHIQLTANDLSRVTEMLK